MYMGFSAGTYLVCRGVEYVKKFDDNNHIADKYFLCRFNYRGLHESKCVVVISAANSEFITIREEQLVIL